MLNSKQHHLLETRNSSIELLKIIGIILIVISHVVQTLYAPNEYVTTNAYILNVSRATVNAQQFILTLLQYGGSFGNTVFFACSAWFLLESHKSNKKKIFQMLMDTWVVSILILIVVYVIRNGNIDIELIIKQILPTTFGNNWYITCYLLFYLLHPSLNWVIKKMEQPALLKSTLLLFFLYFCVNYIMGGLFFSSNLIFWIALYFIIAYIKYFLVDLSNNIKTNLILFAFGFLGNIGIVLLTNILGLRVEMLSNSLLRWNTNCSPFLLMMAISMLNIARNIHFKSNAINYISSLSLLIYIFHENLLLRTFYRPLMWNYIYTQFGYTYVIVWTLVLTVIVFCFGLMASFIYKNTIQKIVVSVCNWLYPILQKLYSKAETKILEFR